MLRFGLDDAPVVVVAPPLFEEANRTRAFLVRTLRLLAERGVASVLPDLPGQGESLMPTLGARLSFWREAFAYAAEHATVGRIFAGTLAVRAGALVDALPSVPARLRFAPLTGDELTRELRRVRAAAGRPRSSDGAIEIAGNLLSPDLLRDLETATPHDDPSVPTRIVRLDTDPRPADRSLPGPPLWRRSEPDADEPLAEALADDVADWVARCAA